MVIPNSKENKDELVFRKKKYLIYYLVITDKKLRS